MLVAMVVETAAVQDTKQHAWFAMHLQKTSVWLAAGDAGRQPARFWWAVPGLPLMLIAPRRLLLHYPIDMDGGHAGEGE